MLYDPGIVIVCQGHKRGWFGQRLYRNDALQYLAVSVPVPFTMETDASAEEPLLALYLQLDFALAANLMLEIDRLGGGASDAQAQSMVSSPMDATLCLAVQRLLKRLPTRWRRPCSARSCCASCTTAY